MGRDQDPKDDPALSISRDQRLAFGRGLRAARERAGLTQTRLSQLTGIESKHISRIENGKANLTLETMTALAKALGLELRLHLTPPEKP